MILSNFRTLNNWFYENVLIFNPKKCYFMSLGKDTHDEGVFCYDNFTFINSNEEEILGVTIDRKFKIYHHNKKMCCKAG